MKNLIETRDRSISKASLQMCIDFTHEARYSVPERRAQSRSQNNNQIGPIKQGKHLNTAVEIQRA